MIRQSSKLRAANLGLVLGGVFVVAVLVGFIALALTAQRGLPLRSYYTLHADFRDVANIEEYSDVRIAGQLVGQVLDSSYDGGVASLTLQLSPSVQPLRSSTTARIRLKGLLGAKYVDLVPGRAGTPIPNSGTIPLSRTSTTVDVFHLLESIDAPRQADLRLLLGALGEGFLGRGAGLNQALTQAPAVTADTGSFAAAVLARPGAAARLVPDAESLSAAIAPVSGALASGFAPQGRALEPFSAERAAVQSTLSLAPSALDATRAGLAETDPLLSETAGFARAAVTLTRVAPSSLRQATALLQAAPGPLRTTAPLLTSLSAAVPPTLKLTGGLDPLLAPAVRGLDHALPILTSVGARGCDLLGFVRNWRSLLGYGQSSAGNAIGPSNYVMVGVAAGADMLGPSGRKPASLVGHDPDPAPCTAATEHLG